MYILLLGARSIRRKVFKYLYRPVLSLFWVLFPHCLTKDEISSGTRGVINLYTFKNHTDTIIYTFIDPDIYGNLVLKGACVLIF